MSDYARDIRSFVTEHLDPQGSARKFAAQAREALTEYLGPIHPERTVYVDGDPLRDESAVKPGGSIAYDFSYNADILQFALEELRERSPRRNSSLARGGPGPGSERSSTPFAESFWVSIAGKFIAPGDLNLEHVPGGDVELIIGNVQPYNRRVTVQMNGRRPISFSVAPGLYAAAAREVNARFGNVVQARAVYNLRFPGKYTLKQTQMRTGERSHNVKRWAGRPVDSPGLIINPR